MSSSANAPCAEEGIAEEELASAPAAAALPHELAAQAVENAAAELVDGQTARVARRAP